MPWLERHRHGPRFHVAGHRVHEWHVGGLVLAVAPLALVLDVWDLSVQVWVAVAVGLWLVAKDWQDLVPSRRDTTSWSLGFHRRRYALRRLRRADQLPAWLAVATAAVQCGSRERRPVARHLKAFPCLNPALGVPWQREADAGAVSDARPTRSTMVRVLARSRVGVVLLGLGAAGGAALAARPDPPPVPKAVSAPTAPVEIRTVIKRRTVHVYRKPKRRRAAPPAPPAPPVASAVPTAIPAPVVTAAPVRVTQPVAPAAPRRPLETRTSGSGGKHGDDEGEHEHESEHDD